MPWRPIVDPWPAALLPAGDLEKAITQCDSNYSPGVFLQVSGRSGCALHHRLSPLPPCLRAATDAWLRCFWLSVSTAVGACVSSAAAGRQCGIFPRTLPACRPTSASACRPPSRPASMCALRVSGAARLYRSHGATQGPCMGSICVLKAAACIVGLASCCAARNVTPGCCGCWQPHVAHLSGLSCTRHLHQARWRPPPTPAPPRRPSPALPSTPRRQQQLQVLHHPERRHAGVDCAVPGLVAPGPGEDQPPGIHPAGKSAGRAPEAGWGAGAVVGMGCWV